MGIQAAIGLVETYFIAKLGTDALAGLALVFPVQMLFVMITAGAMGGGILSAVARALGAARQDDANTLAWQAVWIALALGLLTTIVLLAIGPALYARDGRAGRFARGGADLFQRRVRGRDSALALQFARRGHSRHRQHVGAGVGDGGRRCHPHSAVAGSDLRARTDAGFRHRRRRRRRASPSMSSGSAVFAWLHLVGPRRVASVGEAARLPLAAGARHPEDRRAVVRSSAPPPISRSRPQPRLVGVYGPAAVAGFGTAVRLEYLLVPLVFGLGAPVASMVGTNIGAHQNKRALRIAWTGAAISGGLTGAIGVRGSDISGGLAVAVRR